MLLWRPRSCRFKISLCLREASSPSANSPSKDVPEWLKKDDEISLHDRMATQICKHALISEYEADSYGHPDPEWKGQQPRGIQELRFQSAMLANMSMWMIMPSKVCFTVCFHALTKISGRELDTPVVNHVDREGPLYCHPKDEHNPVKPKDLMKAAQLFETLSTVPRKNDVWPALRAFWAALASYWADYRYPLFWQGLESLFGNDDDRGVSRRLRARISYFLADNVTTQQDLGEKVKACYRVRSEIVHGRWEDDPNFDDHMYTTEAIVRTVMRHIADKSMLPIFLSPKRDQFLEAWVQSKASLPPTVF
jgi:Apea-like HEPN